MLDNSSMGSSKTKKELNTVTIVCAYAVVVASYIVFALVDSINHDVHRLMYFLMLVFHVAVLVVLRRKRNKPTLKQRLLLAPLYLVVWATVTVMLIWALVPVFRNQ